MKERGSVNKIAVMLIVGLFLTTTLITLASSEEGFFKSLRSLITGRATSNTFNLNITIGNSPPNITFVGNFSPQDITEAGQTRVTFYFTANDSDGYQNLNTGSAKANFTFYNSTGLIYTRINDSCTSLGNIDAYTLNFSCTISLWYFDPAGTNGWNITAYVEDNSGSSAQNYTTRFTLQTTQAFTIHPSTFTFPGITPGATNSTSGNDPLTLNNTGNYAFGVTTTNMSVNATNLVGETNSAYGLYARNFTVGTYGADSTVNCGNSTWSHFMGRGTYTNITTSNSSLAYGNLTLGNGIAQMNMFICLTKAGNELISQSYSTNGPNSEGSWRIRVG
jgi:hypothetical protein